SPADREPEDAADEREEQHDRDPEDLVEIADVRLVASNDVDEHADGEREIEQRDDERHDRSIGVPPRPGHEAELPPARNPASYPSAQASSLPRRNMSSAAGRTRADAPGSSSPDTRCESPRTIATGSPLVLPLTRSAAAAISSATAATVTSMRRPFASAVPLRSS